MTGPGHARGELQLDTYAPSILCHAPMSSSEVLSAARCRKSTYDCVYVHPKASVRPNVVEGSPQPEGGSADDKIETLNNRIKDLDAQHTKLLQQHGAAIDLLLSSIGESSPGAYLRTTIGVGSSTDNFATHPSASRKRHWSDSSSSCLSDSSRQSSPSGPTDREQLPYPYLSEEQLVVLGHDRFPGEKAWSGGSVERHAGRKGLIEAGILNHEQAASYFKLYQRFSAHRIPSLQPITSLPLTPTILRDVVLTLGVRADTCSSSEALHRRCVQFIRHRLLMAHKIEPDDVHAAVIFSTWYADARMIRMAVGWAYEIGLHHAPYALQMFRKRLDEETDKDVVSSKLIELTQRLRIWLSCCNAELM